MKKLYALGLAASAMSAVLMNAAEAPAGGGEAPAESQAEAAAAAPKPEKKERVRKNGQTRPEVGSKTGLIWDIADKFVTDNNRVPTKDEVWALYSPGQKEPSQMTLATQYGRWVIFHGFQQHVKANRLAAKAAKEASEKDEKAKQLAKKEADKLAKAKEKEEAKKKREAEKEAKAKAKEAAAKAKENPTPDNGEADANADTSGDTTSA